MVGNPVDVGNPGCHKPTMTGDGWNPTHRNGDDLGMVYGVGFTTLPTKYMEIPVFTRICTM